MCPYKQITRSTKVVEISAKRVLTSQPTTQAVQIELVGYHLDDSASSYESTGQVRCESTGSRYCQQTTRRGAHGTEESLGERERKAGIK